MHDAAKAARQSAFDKRHAIASRSISVRLAFAMCAPFLAIAAGMPATVAAAPFEIYYEHILTNKTNAPLHNVKIFMPIPQSDSYQTVSCFEVVLWDQPFRSNPCTDKFNQECIRILIPRLDPGQSIEVGYACEVELHGFQRRELSPARAGGLDDIPEDIRELYTRDHGGIYDLKHPAIVRESARLCAEKGNLVDKVLAIHDFVAGSIKYEAGGGWQKAPIVLERKRGSCSEFSYLFAALCRASGIPTRFVGASTFPARSKLPFRDARMHRWVEVYLPPWGWVPFDPTLDAGRPPRREFAGHHHERTLIQFRGGGGSNILGSAYYGANTKTGQTRRIRAFTWSRGTRTKYEKALRRYQKKEFRAAYAQFKRLATHYPSTRHGKLAALKMREMETSGEAKP